MLYLERYTNYWKYFCINLIRIGSSISFYGNVFIANKCSKMRLPDFKFLQNVGFPLINLNYQTKVDRFKNLFEKVRYFKTFKNVKYLK